MKQETTTDLRANVLKRITTEQICPRSKFFYMGRECLVWTLWLVTVLFGAVAVALIFGSFLARQYGLYEFTHESWLQAMIEAIPYLWFALFFTMIYAALYNLRHTKAGYRYPIWVIVSSSVTFSIALGGILYAIGASLYLDTKIGEQVEMYQSNVKQEQSLWQQPGAGRLVGTYETDQGSSGVLLPVFTDVAGTVWVLALAELPPFALKQLETEERVRLFGILIDLEPPTFLACAVFPWVFNTSPNLQEIDARHRDIKARTLAHYQTETAALKEEGKNHCFGRLHRK